MTGLGTVRSSRSRLFMLMVGLSALQLVPLGAAQHDEPEAPHGHGWAGTWSASPAPPGSAGISRQGFAGQTVRMAVRTSIGGSQLRVRLSNAFGAQPVTFEAATVGRQAEGAWVEVGSIVPLRFGGQRSVTVRPGADAYSDPVPLTIGPQEDITVSLYVPRPTGPLSWHAVANATSWVAAGNQTAEESGGAFSGSFTSWFWLSGIDVANPFVGRVVVTLGDSTTAGTGSTRDANNRYSDVLARRLLATVPTARQVSVLNAGIGGNRMLHDGPAGVDQLGVKAVARFDRDVLAQTGVTDVILLEGNNDIGFSASLAPDQEVSVSEIIEGMRNLTTRAHAKGVRIYGGTLPPLGGSRFFTEAGEAKRQAVNTWIRTSREFDAVIDFDAALRDPFSPLRLRPEFNSGDDVHPNDAGYQAMANAIDMALFGISGVSR